MLPNAQVVASDLRPVQSSFKINGVYRTQSVQGTQSAVNVQMIEGIKNEVEIIDQAETKEQAATSNYVNKIRSQSVKRPSSSAANNSGVFNRAKIAVNQQINQQLKQQQIPTSTLNMKDKSS